MGRSVLPTGTFQLNVFEDKACIFKDKAGREITSEWFLGLEMIMISKDWLDFYLTSTIFVPLSPVCCPVYFDRQIILWWCDKDKGYLPVFRFGMRNRSCHLSIFFWSALDVVANRCWKQADSNVTAFCSHGKYDEGLVPAWVYLTPVWSSSASTSAQSFQVSREAVPLHVLSIASLSLCSRSPSGTPEELLELPSSTISLEGHSAGAGMNC